MWVLNLNTYAQVRVINNKGTFFSVDTSKWVLSGIDIYNKNTGNVGVGIYPNNARFVVSGTASLPAFKLKYPFSGLISDSILTWNPIDSTVRRINTNVLLNNFLANAWTLTGNAGTDPATNFIGTTDNQRLVFRTNNTEKMTILSDGSVGIGVTTPSNRLHINAATNPLRLEGLQTNTTDNNILVATSTGVIQQRTLLSFIGGLNFITSMNGLTATSQTFATGNTGTDFNIYSNGFGHTFNIPNASNSATLIRGLLTRTDWITFNSKIGIVTATDPDAVITVPYTATIKNDLARWNANKLQNSNVSTVAPTDGQVLAWDGGVSIWVPRTITANSWALTGNTGTISGTNFLGTTDNVRLDFRTNNTIRMTLAPTTGNLGIGSGTTNPQNRLQVTSATANTSGVRLTNFTNKNALATDSNGDIIEGVVGKDHHIKRLNSTPNVAPTSTEVVNPNVGFTAKVHLTNGNVEYWSFTGSVWQLDWTQIPPVDGVDIGYIVAWGSNATPPDYLLPLSGGTYNWSAFPHLKALQSTHHSQFITDSTATTFTLADFNNTKRFLRGGNTPGALEPFATAIPFNPFVLSDNTHSHTYTLPSVTPFLNTVTGGILGSSTSVVTSLNTTNTTPNTSSNTHTHSLISGGDSETRPINASVIWCLKVKPTMTAGNITINMGGPSETTVSNAVGGTGNNSLTTTVNGTTGAAVNMVSTVVNTITGDSITTTVNGVSSTTVALPSPKPAIIEIYDAAGTQTLSPSYADLTFGTTNMVDAGYTVGGSGSQITITTAGTYRITYRVTITVTTNSSSGGELRLTRNGTEVPGTIGYTYQRNNDANKGTVTVVKLLTVAANDIIKVQGRRYSSTGSLSLTANGSSLIIERIK